MPDSPFPMTLQSELTLIGEPCVGNLQAQQAALRALIKRSDWPEWSTTTNGKPVWEAGHLSLSHGGGWVIAARGKSPIGVDVETASERLQRARRKYVGPADQAVLDLHGDNLDALCRIWTAKEAAFKVFGTGVDFLTGLQWEWLKADEATVLATAQKAQLHITWHRLEQPDAWLATARAVETPP